MPRTTDRALVDDAVRAVNESASISAAARKLGITRNQIRHRLSLADQHRPDDTTFSDDVDRKTGRRTLTVPVELDAGTKVVGLRTLEDAIAFHGIDLDEWRIVRYRVNSWGSPAGDGDKVSTQVRVDLDPVASSPILDAIGRLAKRLPVKAAIKKPARLPRTSPLVVCGPYDVHLGQLVWSGEAVADDDIRLTSARFRASIDAIVERISHAKPGRVIVPFGHDFIHFENERAETASGAHAVDYDSRYAKVIETAHGLIEHMIDRFLALGCELEVVYVPCNHAPLASLHLAHWIRQRYSREKRLSVDAGFGKFKFREHGVNLLGFTHGHHMKKATLYDVMAEHAGHLWGGKLTRDWHIGHFHASETMPPRAPRKDTMASVMIRQNPSLSETSRYAHNLGFVGTPAVAAFLYDHDCGYLGEMVQPMPRTAAR